MGFDSARPGQRERSLLAELPGGRVCAVTPERTAVVPGAVSSGDLLAAGADGSLALYSPSGERKRVLPWALTRGPFEEAVRVSGDGRSVYLRSGSVPARIERAELANGSRSLWRVLAPKDPTGVGHIWSIYLTPDGRGYAYTHGLFLHDLFMVDGLVSVD